MLYRVVCDFDFQNNEKMLMYVYSHIIGMKAVNMYQILINDYHYLKNLYTKASLQEDHLLKLLAVDANEFNAIKNKLEAIGLIKTYVDNNKPDNVLFKLLQPLNWNQFNDDEKMYNLYKNHVSELDFEQTRYVFEGNNQLVGLTNTSVTFEQEFDNVAPKLFDFNCLYDELFKITGSIITINEDIKNEINENYINGKINQNEVVSICFQSLFKEGKQTKLDNKIFKVKLKCVIDAKGVQNFQRIQKINRNIDFFLKEATDAEIQKIIKDYHSLNSEQYLACIQNNPITDLDIKLIDKLRHSYKLPDFIINILIDYSILINHGRIEPMYLQKIAITINRLNFNSVDMIINHLKSAAKHHFNQSNEQRNIQW